MDLNTKKKYKCNPCDKTEHSVYSLNDGLWSTEKVIKLFKNYVLQLKKKLIRLGYSKFGETCIFRTFTEHWQFYHNWKSKNKYRNIISTDRKLQKSMHII